MYKNKYLDQCLKNQTGSVDLLNNYLYTQAKQLEVLVINELPFISQNADRLNLFKNELIKANVKELLLIDNGTSLMNVIHALDKINIKIKGLATTDIIDKWDDTKHQLQGLLMEIK